MPSPEEWREVVARAPRVVARRLAGAAAILDFLFGICGGERVLNALYDDVLGERIPARLLRLLGRDPTESTDREPRENHLSPLAGCVNLVAERGGPRQGPQGRKGDGSARKPAEGARKQR